MPFNINAERERLQRGEGIYESPVNDSPDYLNSFQSWLDGPINEKSWNWTREAYNRSLQGMVDKMLTGKQRYNLDKGYNLNVLEDIGSTALSFMMPLDFLAMAAGGAAARGGLALAGVNVKMARAARQIGMGHIIPQMAQQAGALSVYEGAIGGVQAAIDGNDVWEGVTDGAMHGAVLGGIAGGVGGGLGYVNAELIRSFEGAGKLAGKYGMGTKEATKMLTGTDHAKLIASGTIGQIGAESGVFTAAEQYENVMNGGDFRYQDALKSYFKNLGLFGVLKVKGKVVEKLFDKGNMHLDMLEAAEREKLGVKEDGVTSEGRALDNILQGYIAQERKLRGEGKIDQADQLLRDIDMLYGEKTGVDAEHTKNLEEYRALRSTINRIRESGDISEDTVVDFKNALNSLIAVEDRLIKNASDAVAPFYKNSKRDFERTLDDLVKLSEETDGNHGKGEEAPLEPWRREIIEYENILKDQDGKPILIDGKTQTRFDFSKEGGYDLESIEGRQKATKRLEQEQDRLADLEGRKKGQTMSIAELQGRRDPSKISKKDVDSIIQQAKEGTGKPLKTKEGRVKTPKDNALIEIDKAFPEADAEGKPLKLSKVARTHKNILAEVINQSRQKNLLGAVKETSEFLNWVEKRYKENITKLSDTQIKNLARDYVTEKLGYDVFVSKAEWNKLGIPANKSNFIRSQGIRIYDNLSKMSNAGLADFLPLRKRITEGLTKPVVEGERAVVVGKVGKTPREAIDDAADWSKKQSKVGELSGEGASLAIRVANLFRARTGEIRYLEADQVNPETGAIGFKTSKDGKVRIKVDLDLAKDLDAYMKANNLKGKEGVFKITPEEFGKITYEAVEKSGGEINVYQSFEGEVYGWGEPIPGALTEGKGMTRASFGRSPAEIYRRVYETEADQARLRAAAEGRGHQTTIATKRYVAPTEITTKEHKLQLESAASEMGTSLKEMKAQIKYFKEKYPEFEIYLKDKLGKFQGEYILGRVSGYVAEIARGRARADTIPHEISHHVVDILRAFGDKKSKDLIREGESKFNGEEGLVQSIGEFVAGRMRNKSMASKVKNWLQKFWSNMKTKLGIHNEADITRLLGEKVLEGKLPEGRLVETATKYQTAQNIRNVMNRIKVNGLEDKVDPSVKRKARLDVFGTTNLTGKLHKYTVEQVRDYEKILTDAKGGGKNSSLARLTIPDINKQYHVSPEASTQILKLMGVKDGMYEYASKEQAQEYSSYIRQQYDKPVLERSNFDEVQELGSKKFSWKQYVSRGMMPVWLVLKNYGGEPGKKIAKSLLDHEWVEHVKYRGPGDQAMHTIKKRLGNKIKYIHLFDKERAKRNYDEGNLTVEERSFYDNVFGKNPNKNSDEYKAHQTWNALSEFYWKSLETELSKHQTPQEVKDIMKELDRKKVDGYMTRRLTKKGLEYIEKDKNFIADLVNENIKGGAARAEAKKRLKVGSEEEIKILEERLKDISTKEGQEFYEDVRTELYDSMVYGYATVKNPHLIERNSLLKEHVEVTNDKGRLEKIKVYDDSMSATAETYVTRMSKYLASVRLFPEWTGVGSKYKIDMNKRKIMEQMETRPDMAGYSIKAIKRQLGIDKTEMQALNMPTYRVLGALTHTSAALGLSSPMSGIKNLLIGIPRSIGDFGFLNTMSGIKKSFSSLAYHEARRRGELEYGAKTLELGTIGIGRFFNLRNMFKYINWMTPTENFNRIVSSHAGHLYFAQAQSILRGEGGMFKMGTNKKRMQRLMEELWHLDAEEISFLKNAKDFSSQEAMSKHAEILHKVGHFSHVSAQGGTSTVLLPLWMSSKEAKPFTLFQRIATATTIDTHRNFIKPIVEFGNIMPLARAALAHSVSGAVLYAMYDELFGKIKPVGSEKLQGDWFSDVMMNLWRSEFFGMFGEALSPHEKDLAVPLNTPIILRNLSQAGTEFRQYMLGGKSLSQAATDYAKKTAVIVGQFGDAFPKVHSSKYYKDFMQIRSMKHKYLKEKGEARYSDEGAISRRSPYYRNLKYAMMFGSDEDIGKEYWKAFSAIVDMELQDDPYMQPWKVAKSVRQSIKQTIKLYDPYNISDKMEGTTKSKQQQFLDWLTPENKRMAESVKAQYQVRLRRYLRVIADPKWRNEWSAFPNL